MAALSLAKAAIAVEQELQAVPNVRLWKARVRSTLSDVAADLWSMAQWPWRIREAPLWVYPDFELTKAQLALPGDPSTKRVWGSNALATVLSAAGMFPAADATGGTYEKHREQLVGAELGIESPSATDLTNGNWHEGPFTIEKVGPGSALATQLWLDPRCNVTSVDAAGGSYHVRFPRYLLPYDCDQLLMDGVKTDRGLTMPWIDHQTFRWMQLGTARPPAIGGGMGGYWTFDEGVDSTAPIDRAHSPNFLVTDTQAPAWIDHHRNVPIRETITAAVSATAGTYTVGQLYRFGVAWYYQNRFGPMSNVAEVTPTAGNQSVALAALPTVPTNAFLTDSAYGWALAVFVAKGDGPFYWLQYINPGTSATLTTSAPPATSQLHGKRLRYDMLNPGIYRYIRIHPRPASHLKYQIRYLRRPVPWQDESDTPEFAEQFHMYLVYEAAARLAAIREGASSRSSLMLRLQGLAAHKLAELMQSYFPGAHVESRKGSILSPNTARLSMRNGVDWNP